MHDRPSQLDLRAQRGGTTTEKLGRTFSFTYGLSKPLCSTAINGYNNSSFYYVSAFCAQKLRIKAFLFYYLLISSTFQVFYF